MMNKKRMDAVRLLFEKHVHRIQTHAGIYFRSVKCWHKRQDFIAETVALSWKWWIRLYERGRDPTQFVARIADFAARAVNSGRRVADQESPKDVLSRTAQKSKGFCCTKLPDFSTLSTNPLAEALTDNTQSEVPEQVAFRVDFPNWILTYPERNREVIFEMMLKRTTTELARKFKLSQGRISQLRLEFSQDWNLYTL